MKIALSGPSGLGKTTLCKWISQRFPDIQWVSVSAGDLLTQEDKDYLKEAYGYRGGGHRNVIEMSWKIPAFGRDFQILLLKRRTELIQNLDNFVIDRSPLDNVVYFLMQAAVHCTEPEIANFIEIAKKGFSQLDKVILVQYSSDIPEIEDNHSRIANRYFQRTVSDVFNAVYGREFAHLVGPRVVHIDFWDIGMRKMMVENFIKSEL